MTSLSGGMTSPRATTASHSNGMTSPRVAATTPGILGSATVLSPSPPASLRSARILTLRPAEAATGPWKRVSSTTPAAGSIKSASFPTPRPAQHRHGVWARHSRTPSQAYAACAQGRRRRACTQWADLACGQHPRAASPRLNPQRESESHSCSKPMEQAGEAGRRFRAKLQGGCAVAAAAHRCTGGLL